MSSAPVMLIGEAAAVLGLSVDRVRQLEAGGQLQARWRSRAGLRLYAPEDVQALLEIRRGRELARRARKAQPVQEDAPAA